MHPKCVLYFHSHAASSSQSISEFLKDLPCHNEENFSLFNTENGVKTSSKRPSVYIPTLDIPSEQVIVTEKKNILLRYLQHQWDKKNPSKKRELENATNDLHRKRPRLDTRDNNNT
ncbi:AGAP008078-PA-like protein [Anopheles sinensis]|uniref:DET1- and DDB1-associated protein 1 n=1 Tax=Anopheles sinensis TaxID=74873 RepID=A0A084VN84_ANOSI|nr:AGAP008078-PA-like protein [Anopheles sinensis]